MHAQCSASKASLVIYVSSYPACPRRITVNYCIHTNEMSVNVLLEKHNTITREKKNLHLRRIFTQEGRCYGYTINCPFHSENEMFWNFEFIGVKWPLGNMLKIFHFYAALILDLFINTIRGISYLRAAM